MIGADLMAITLIFANVGTGKTTYLAKLANSKKTRKKYKDIYSNVPIDNTYRLDTQNIGKFHVTDALILIDEGAIHFDNRMSLKEYQKTYFRLHRHYNCDIVIVSQSYEDINIILRRLYTRIYLMKQSIFPCVTKLKRIYKTIDIDKETHSIIESYQFGIFFNNKYLFRPKYYKYFNSFDRPQLLEFVKVAW